MLLINIKFNLPHAFCLFRPYVICSTFSSHISGSTFLFSFGFSKTTAWHLSQLTIKRLSWYHLVIQSRRCPPVSYPRSSLFPLLQRPDDHPHTSKRWHLIFCSGKKFHIRSQNACGHPLFTTTQSLDTEHVLTVFSLPQKYDLISCGGRGGRGSVTHIPRRWERLFPDDDVPHNPHLPYYNGALTVCNTVLTVRWLRVWLRWLYVWRCVVRTRKPDRNLVFEAQMQLSAIRSRSRNIMFQAHPTETGSKTHTVTIDASI